MSIVQILNKPRTFTVKHIYKEYAKRVLKENPEWWGKYEKRMPNYRIFRKEGTQIIEVMNYARYRHIVETWFYRAQAYIINGDVLSMGNNLGKIGGREVERNFKNKVTNWKATHEMWKEKGERKGHVYHLDPTWCRIGWNKPGKIKHEKFYRFTPAEGNKTNDGFKSAFSKANEANPLLKKKYQFFAYVKD